MVVYYTSYIHKSFRNLETTESNSIWIQYIVVAWSIYQVNSGLASLGEIVGLHSPTFATVQVLDTNSSAEGGA